MRLFENYEKAGYFWVPSTLEEKLPGTIRISDSGEAELEILGIFVGRLKHLIVIIKSNELMVLLKRAYAGVGPREIADTA
jgi:hypothetical protein